MMANSTLYWHDYETFGLDPKADRPAQFAGLRTDFELNIIAEPQVLYCQPAVDYLPHPESCLVTGITPQTALQKGVCEAEFIAVIHQQLAQPGTCTVGYNNIRFDDEVTRNTLYRNFYDPYAREWQHGNSRWDLIDLLRATRALRPAGINWPVKADGSPSFRLEDLTEANAISHQSAHDALSDVYATIAVAQLVKKAQPKLYDFVFTHRSKTKVSELLKLGNLQPVIHVSGMYAAEHSRLAVVLPLCKHPTNNNGVLVYDLSEDPDALISLDVEQIHHRLFTAVDALPENTRRIALKTVHINKCPVLAPMSALLPEDAERLQIDMQQCFKHLELLKRAQHLQNKLHQVFSTSEFAQPNDPDLMLYSGGFFGDHDRAIMQTIRSTAAEQLAALTLNFQDARLTEMFFRYRARNFPQTLSVAEALRWREHCVQHLSDTTPEGAVSFAGMEQALQSLEQQQNTDSALIAALRDYTQDLQKKLNIH